MKYIINAQNWLSGRGGVERGSTATEYAIIASLIAGVIAAVVGAIGGSVSGDFVGVNDALETVSN